MRHGVTIIEAMVVLALIGVLASLVAPAVQAARANAGKTACQNNLRQVGLALHAFAGLHGHFVPYPYMKTHVSALPSAPGYIWATTWQVQLTP